MANQTKRRWYWVIRKVATNSYLGSTWWRTCGRTASWYLCDECCVLVVFWLEDEYRDRSPAFEREQISDAIVDVNLRLRPR